jgi:NodT family efflux transporter outer membrane factor (OMF) lipoprotein
MKRRILLACGLAASLQACNLAPKPQVPTTSVPVAYKESGPWRPANPDDTALRGAWWRVFGDPTLDGLEPLVDQDNQDLAATVARYDIARAMASQAEAGLFPSIGLGASLSNNRESQHRPLRGATSPNDYGSNTLDATGNYEVDLWGRVRNEAAQGRLLAQASAADLAGMRLSLQAELASDYLSLRGLDAQAAFLDQTVTAFQRALDLTQTRFAGHISSGLDVARAQTQLDTAKAQVSDVASRRALMEHAIAALVGKPPADLSLPASTLDPVPPAPPTGLPSTLLERRPDIAAAERRVAVANAGIGIARAAFYPSLTLGGEAGTQDTGLDLLSLPLAFWTFGPNVSLPIFEGGALEAKKAEAYGQFREAAADYRSTVIEAFRDVEDNLALIHWLGREETDEDAGTAAAKQALDIALNLYRQGVDSYLEVVTAQTTYLEAEEAALDIQTRRLTADVGLIRALGGGWTRTDLPDAEAATTRPPDTMDPVRPATTSPS